MFFVVRPFRSPAESLRICQWYAWSVLCIKPVALLCVAPYLECLFREIRMPLWLSVGWPIFRSAGSCQWTTWGHTCRRAWVWQLHRRRTDHPDSHCGYRQQTGSDDDEFCKIFLLKDNAYWLATSLHLVRQLETLSGIHWPESSTRLCRWSAYVSSHSRGSTYQREYIRHRSSFQLVGHHCMTTSFCSGCDSPLHEGGRVLWPTNQRPTSSYLLGAYMPRGYRYGRRCRANCRALPSRATLLLRRRHNPRGVILFSMCVPPPERRKSV